MALILSNKSHRQQLLDVARASIRYGLDHGKPMPVNLISYPPELQAIGATFVTLQVNKNLRGCIGVLIAKRPLVEDVAENAFSAAFKDKRFPPLKPAEYKDLDIHISLLTPAKPMMFNSEQDLIAQLRPGIDGLILQEGSRRSTFLPTVWESLPQPDQFLKHLKLKAGLPADYWSSSIRCFRYRAESIH